MAGSSGLAPLQQGIAKSAGLSGTTTLCLGVQKTELRREDERCLKSSGGSTERADKFAAEVFEAHDRAT